MVADCPSPGTPLGGVSVNLFRIFESSALATTITDQDGHYAFDGLDVGTYNVIPSTSYVFSFPCGEVDHVGCPFTTVFTPDSHPDLDIEMRCPRIRGSVQYFCPPVLATCCVPFSGVVVDAFSASTSQLVTSAITGGLGEFELTVLPGQYNVSAVIPLGYSTTFSGATVDAQGSDPLIGDIVAECIAATGTPRSVGFWKHQLGVAVGGHGNAQLTATTLGDYLGVVQAHFNNNALNQVDIYEAPPEATCAQKLAIASGLLNMTGSMGALEQARSQLLALLLNAAANYIGLQDVASRDGATVSQAITYCDALIDNPLGDRSLAATIADRINNGQKIQAGVIPLDTQNIAYARSVGPSFKVAPNPAVDLRTFSFALESASDVRIGVFDISGRLVAQVARATLQPGSHVVRWDGRKSDGTPLPGGVYFARLMTGARMRSVALIQLPQ